MMKPLKRIASATMETNLNGKRTHIDTFSKILFILNFQYVLLSQKMMMIIHFAIWCDYQTGARLVKETRDIEDAVELNDPTLARHVRFDSRYNWKCD